MAAVAAPTPPAPTTRMRTPASVQPDSVPPLAETAFSTPADLTGLRDKVALVTGGASGLGRATVLALAEAGAEVVVVDVDADGGAAVAEQVGGHFVAADVSDLQANRDMVAFAIERCGGLDYAYLNAGIGDRRRDRRGLRPRALPAGDGRQPRRRRLRHARRAAARCARAAAARSSRPRRWPA